MTPAEISLAFAREVAGHPDAFWAGDYLDNGSAQRLPDYANDWNATIAAVEARGWTFRLMSGALWARDVTVRSDQGVFYGHGELDEPRAIALCRAALECARGPR